MGGCITRSKGTMGIHKSSICALKYVVSLDNFREGNIESLLEHFNAKTGILVYYSFIPKNTKFFSGLTVHNAPDIIFYPFLEIAI